MEFSAIFHDTKGIFAITRECKGQQVTLLAHAKAGDVDLEEGQLSDYVGMENLLTKELFSGYLSAFELAVLVKK